MQSTAVWAAGLPLPSFPQHSISVRYATEHRCGVVVRGPGLSDAITGTDPLKDNLPLQVCPIYASILRTVCNIVKLRSLPSRKSLCASHTFHDTLHRR